LVVFVNYLDRQKKLNINGTTNASAKQPTCQENIAKSRRIKNIAIKIKVVEVIKWATTRRNGIRLFT
jgi:hypothetical protein